MKREVTYLGIEKITYEFSEYEVMEALMEKYNIKRTSDREFFMFEGDDEEDAYVEITVRYSQKKDE